MDSWTLTILLACVSLALFDWVADKIANDDL